MKKILVVLVLFLCAFSLFAYTQNMLEFSVSPSSVEYIDFPNSSMVTGANVGVFSERGIGLGFDWAMRTNSFVFGVGIDADGFLMPTYTEYGQYRLDVTALCKAGFCFGQEIEISALATAGAKMIVSENFWFSYAVGAEAKILMPVTDAFWLGYKATVDFTNFLATNSKYDSNVFSGAGCVIFSWRLN